MNYRQVELSRIRKAEITQGKNTITLYTVYYYRAAVLRRAWTLGRSCQNQIWWRCGLLMVYSCPVIFWKIWIHWKQQHLSDFIQGCMFQLKQCQFHTKENTFRKKILISTVYECQWSFLSKIDRRCFVFVVVLVLMSKKDSYMKIPLKLQAFVKMTILSTRMLTEIKY